MHRIPTDPSLVIRTARGSDGTDLARLAELDSAPVLGGPALVAEVDGRIVAAVGTDSGARIADPFVPTAGVLDLLDLRAAQARAGRPHEGRLRRPVLRHPGARAA